MTRKLELVQAHDPTGAEMLRRVPEEGTVQLGPSAICVVEPSSARRGHGRYRAPRPPSTGKRPSTS
jgi:hypothetical protein